MRERADRARKFSRPKPFPSLFQAALYSLNSEYHKAQTKSEARRLGVNAVRSADLRRVFEFVSARFKTSKSLSIFGKELRTILSKKRVCRVNDIARR
jgi:hypothetical protein